MPTNAASAISTLRVADTMRRAALSFAEDALRPAPPSYLNVAIGPQRTVITHRMAMSVTDSQWHRQLAARVDGADPSVDTYWLWPFQNYRTFCPYLVGSYERVGAELAAYLERGFRTFILDIPETQDERESLTKYGFTISERDPDPSVSDNWPVP